MQEAIENLEKEGRIFVIRPEFPVQVSRFEQDVRKLEALYEEGTRIAGSRLTALADYLGIAPGENNKIQ